MKFERFEDIIAWQKAQELALNIYEIFKSNKDFSFKDQVQKASISISSNVAEGFERKSNNELKYFCFIAKGSSAEVRSLIYLAQRLGYIKSSDFERCIELATSISKMLSSLIKTL